MGKLQELQKLVQDIPENPNLDYLTEWERGYELGEAALAKKVRQILNGQITK